ncbi:hypothetical protein, partial [Plebeiibacterium marinum]
IRAAKNGAAFLRYHLILNYDSRISTEVTIEDKTAVEQMRLIQQLDDDEKQSIFKLIDKMLTNKNSKTSLIKILQRCKQFTYYGIKQKPHFKNVAFVLFTGQRPWLIRHSETLCRAVFLLNRYDQ